MAASRRTPSPPTPLPPGERGEIESSIWRRLLKRIDFQLLFSFLAILLLILLFRQIANWIEAGATDRIDFQLLRLCRDDTPEMKPLGSPKFVGAVRDFTALGSGTVLTLLVISVSLYYFLQRRWRTGFFLLITSTLGWGLMEWIKDSYARPRPTIVSHLVDETSYSFPSGHAKMSAVIYLTLGAILAQHSSRRSVKIFWLSMAIGLTLCIGCTRVYLGVHHPSDVLAGWLAGTSWALFVFLIARLWRDRHKLLPAKKTPFVSVTNQRTNGTVPQRIWRILGLNVILVLLVLLLLRGRTPLSELVDKIRPGMSLEEVKRILGPPAELDDDEYTGVGYTIHKMVAGKEEPVGVEYHFEPYHIVMESPTLGVRTVHHGAPGYKFVIPYEDVEHRDRDQSQEIFWLDRTHCLWLVQRQDGTVIKAVLVPLQTEEVVVKEWFQWQWRRVKRKLGW